ncbi:conserved protein of unknown function [Candidatus Promineifilum breve]|uniref:HEAT repeat domain-containing protein n=1 Tax=Candidatus Promineifilum breve TaxID=1806508 RepID=A0A161K2S1_9CHLR|nr:hypothetical protein [Candidatus Promineifilum breve]CUS02397.2 conserved protein of unknown function [Candidatus Promineifilum breve]
MSKIDQYREHLRQMCDWDSFLLAESRLPGPRSNLELAQAAADEGDITQFLSWLALDATAAPVNTPGEFLPLCGAMGLGRLLAEGDLTLLPRLRAAANDPRWRLREGVAMALQRWGAADMPALLAEMARWAAGSRYEQRAVVAALCEPPLLHDRAVAEQVLGILNGITATIPGAADRREDGFIALRKALGYGWSVAVVAAPEAGRLMLEELAGSASTDVQWIVRENLSKQRLNRLDAGWVPALRQQLKQEAT